MLTNSDGIGLAWSISEHLQSLLGCLTLMVTHYSMMATELPKLYPNVKVYHMLVMTFMISALHVHDDSMDLFKLLADRGH